MRIAALIARILLGLVFFVFGLNGFLHFIPTGAHCVLPRWSESGPSRNLAL